jgi:hypothetical protein
MAASKPVPAHVSVRLAQVWTRDGRLVVSAWSRRGQASWRLLFTREYVNPAAGRLALGGASLRSWTHGQA